MAANIVNDYNVDSMLSALECVFYQFNLDDLGVDPERRLLSYRLRNVTDGVLLTDDRFVRPAGAGINVPLDFSDDLRGIVYTDAPPIGSSATVQDSNVVKQIEVEYGERILIDCDPPDDSGAFSNTSNTVYVLNGVSHMYDPDLPNAGFLLHYRPTVMYQSSDTEMFYWAFGPLTVDFDYRDSLGSSIGTSQEVIPGGQVNIFAAGFNRVGVPVGTEEIRISIFGATTAIKRLCWGDDQCVKDLYFHSRRGGFDVMSFEELGARQLSTNVVEMCRDKLCTDSRADQRRKGERVVVSKQTDQFLVFERKLDMSCTDSRWIDDCLASKVHYVKEKETGTGQDILMRFVLSSGSQVTWDAEGEAVLRLQGRYSHRIVMPNAA